MPTLHGIADSCYVSDHDRTQHQESHACDNSHRDDEWGWEYDESEAANKLASSGGSGDGSEFNIDYSCYDPYGPSGSRGRRGQQNAKGPSKGDIREGDLGSSSPVQMVSTSRGSAISMTLLPTTCLGPCLFAGPVSHPRVHRQLPR